LLGRSDAGKVRERRLLSNKWLFAFTSVLVLAAVVSQYVAVTRSSCHTAPADDGEEHTKTISAETTMLGSSQCRTKAPESNLAALVAGLVFGLLTFAIRFLGTQWMRQHWALIHAVLVVTETAVGALLWVVAPVGTVAMNVGSGVLVGAFVHLIPLVEAIEAGVTSDAGDINICGCGPVTQERTRFVHLIGLLPLAVHVVILIVMNSPHVDGSLQAAGSLCVFLAIYCATRMYLVGDSAADGKTHKSPQRGENQLAGMVALNMDKAEQDRDSLASRMLTSSSDDMESSANTPLAATQRNPLFP
jgi:hypothetical protein